MKIQTNPYACAICLKEFSVPMALQKHVDTDHKKQKIITKDHEMTHHTGRENRKFFTCPYCQIVFQHQRSLKRHEKRHAGEQLFSDLYCKKTFMENGKRHEKMHTMNKLNHFKIYSDLQTQAQPALQLEVQTQYNQIQHKNNPNQVQIPPQLFKAHTENQYQIQNNENPNHAQAKVPTQLEAQTENKYQIQRENQNQAQHVEDQFKRKIDDQAMSKVMTKHEDQTQIQNGNQMKTKTQRRSDNLKKVATTTASGSPSELDKQVKKNLLVSDPKEKTFLNNQSDGLEKNQGFFPCKYCKKLFKFQRDVKRHEMIHTEVKQFSCKYCIKRFTQKIHLKRHEMVHTGEKPFSCKYCKKAFRDTSNLKRHEIFHKADNQHHETKTVTKPLVQSQTKPEVQPRPHHYNQTEIQTETQPAIQFEKQQYLHQFGDQFEIQPQSKTQQGNLQCKMAFNEKSNLIRPERLVNHFETQQKIQTLNQSQTQQHLDHLKIQEDIQHNPHYNEELFSKESNKENQNNGFKIHHEIAYSKEASFPCRYCNRVFTSQKNTNRHELIHSVEKPFSCKFCSKKFNQKVHLIYHEKIHTGQGLFSCKVCNKEFRQKSDVRRHEIIHSEDKPFSCQYCIQKFNQKIHLMNHEKIHTGQGFFSCKVCKKEFRQQSDVIKHERIHIAGEVTMKCKYCEKRFNQGSR